MAPLLAPPRWFGSSHREDGQKLVAIAETFPVMAPGEIKIEGLGKRYWFRSLGQELANADPVDEEAADAADDDPDDEDGTPFSLFRRPMSEVWALRDVSFHVKPGERVGIIGANGSGKSTLLRLLSRVLPPSEGSIEGAGIVVPFNTLTGPLSPDVSGCDNLRMLARLLGIPRDHLEERLPEIVDFSELGPLAYEKVTRYSDRSFTRLSAAMALFIDAAIYLIDDDIKVGDEAYRLKFNNKLAEVLQRGVTLCYASNKLNTIREYCGRAILLDRGRIAADGEANGVISRFLATSDQAIDLDDMKLAPDDQEVAESTSRARPLIAGAALADGREPLIGWAEQVERAETAWERVLRRWREKNRLKDRKKGAAASIQGESTRGMVHSLNCVDAEGKPISQSLPGESVFVELSVESFEENAKIEVRLELHRLPKVNLLAMVAEPLVPLIADKAGQYLFRVEVPGDLIAYCNECVSLKFVLRVTFRTAGSDERDMVVAKSRFDVRGDVRFQFDEQRFFGGEPATSILEPAPTFVRPPAEIEGFEGAGAAPRLLTRWEMLNRAPAIRPKLAWTIYRLVQSKTERQEEMLHADA
jgi:ABC-2 type transport system ATP-binding protein